MSTSPRRSLPVVTFLSVFSALLAGCGMTPPGSTTASSSALLQRLNGSVYGGQNPVSGSLITLYAAGNTGTASAAQSKLSQAVYSNQNGDFTITGLFSCNPGDLLYLTATGGNAGGGNSPAIALMTVLGPCAQYLANANTTFFNINEVTTVASTSALAKFMTGPQNVGSTAAQSSQLAGAMANVQAMANLTSGAALQTSLGNGIVPQATINSLANSIANCINSQQGTSNCSNLFSVTGGPAGTPAETITAALNVALNPTGNPSGVFLQGTAAPPFMPVLQQAPASFALTVQHPSDVLMYHNDASRSGVQPYEQTLTPGNVNSTQFGKLFSYSVDSYLFAQPLYVGGIGMLDGALHNIVIAATTAGTIYAFDADGNNPTSGSVWSTNYIPSGQRPYTSSDLGGCGNPPQAGVLGTPVIDRSTETLYFVVKSATSNGTTFYHYLHAVSLVDGSEQPGSPALIQPSFPATGTGSSSGIYTFNALAQSQRSALLITPNVGSTGQTIWIAYASQCDAGSYHGLMLAYNGSNVSQMTAGFINTPNGNEGGIWGNSGGPVADSAGYVYALGGNGTFDANSNGSDFGDSAIKLSLPSSGSSTTQIRPLDYFTPSNQLTLEDHDADLGGAEPLLFTDPASGVAPNLMVASDKNGYVYLLNTANLGQYNTGSNGVDGTNGDLQDFGGNDGFIYNFAFFNNTLYTSAPLRAYTYTPGTSSTAGQFNTTYSAQPNNINGSTAPTVSANGSSNALVWGLDQGNTMHAFTAPSLTEIYNTTQAANGRDTPGTWIKFTSPVIANGKVFVSGQGSLTVYGLLP